MAIIQKEEFKIPDFIRKETFYSLSWKEQDYILLLYSRRYTRKEIMRMLYIHSRSGYYALRKKVTEIIQKEQKMQKVSTERTNPTSHIE